MTATAKTPRRRKCQPSPSRSRSVRVARTREVLRSEISFIPNSYFRELDADKAWQRELSEPEPSSLVDPADAESGRLRMPAHLERLCASPLLTPAEERDLFCRMNYLKYRANAIRVTLDERSPDDAKLRLIEQLLSCARRIRNRIVSANTRLVVSIVKKFTDEKNSFDDLLSEGVSCLIKAVEKFDFDRGFRFSTYATSAVRREVYRLMQRSHRDRTRFATGNGQVLETKLDDGESASPSEATWRQLDASITRMIRQLDEREQFIVKARYGFTDLGAKPTFSKLGEHLGVSKERVRQLERRAMDKLRELADEFKLSDPGDLS